MDTSGNTPERKPGKHGFTWNGPITPVDATGPLALAFSIINFIAQLFGLGQQDLSVITTAVDNTWGNLVSTSTFTYNYLGSLGTAVNGIVGAIKSASQWIITAVFQGVLMKLLKAILDFLHKLHDLLAPLIAWLKKLQAIQRQLQNQYMRQVIDLIQRARRILVLFRLLHIGFASKLDTYLARLEGGIGAAFAKMIAQVNAITNVLDTVLDPKLLLRPGHTLASVGGAIGAIHQAIGALGFSSLTCIPQNPAAPANYEPWAMTQTRVSMEIQSNTGDYAEYVAQRDLTLRQYAIDYGTAQIV